VPTETLPSPTPTTPATQAAPQAGTSPAAPHAGVNTGAPNATGNGSRTPGTADRSPEALRAAKQQVARDIVARSNQPGRADDGNQAARGPQGSTGGTARGGDGTPQPGVSATPTTTTNPANPQDPAQAPAQAGEFTYGKRTGLTADQMRQTTKLGERLRLELGPVGERLAEGEALSPDDVTALADHLVKRASRLGAQPGRPGTERSPGDQDSPSGQQPNPQVRNPARGETRGNRQPQPSPTAAGGTDGLDTVLADLELVDEDRTKEVRAHVTRLAERAAQAEEKLNQVTRQRAEERADTNTMAALQAVESEFPELRQQGILSSVLEQLEEFDPEFSRAAEGGPSFLKLFRNAASLVILPQRHQGVRADLLQRTAAERAGAPVQPRITSRPETLAPMTREQARSAIAKAQLEIQDPQERTARIREIKAAVVS
jgi:hypothetical protein